LQPERMSIPCTYPHNDWLMYILYNGDAPFLGQIIRAAIGNIAKEHQSEGVTDALRSYEVSASDSLHTLRGKVVVLLDQDEATRARLCEFKSELVRDWQPACPAKATRFYGQLHSSVIPNWVKDEEVTLAELIDSAREAYLVC
jgi:hypothetical protein